MCKKPCLFRIKNQKDLEEPASLKENSQAVLSTRVLVVTSPRYLKRAGSFKGDNEMIIKMIDPEGLSGTLARLVSLLSPVQQPRLQCIMAAPPTISPLYPPNMACYSCNFRTLILQYLRLYSQNIMILLEKKRLYSKSLLFLFILLTVALKHHHTIQSIHGN